MEIITIIGCALIGISIVAIAYGQWSSNRVLTAGFADLMQLYSDSAKYTLAAALSTDVQARNAIAMSIPPRYHRDNKPPVIIPRAPEAPETGMVFDEGTEL